jgi:hypothetical protein
LELTNSGIKPRSFNNSGILTLFFIFDGSGTRKSISLVLKEGEKTRPVKYCL